MAPKAKNLKRQRPDLGLESLGGSSDAINPNQGEFDRVMGYLRGMQNQMDLKFGEISGTIDAIHNDVKGVQNAQKEQDKLLKAVKEEVVTVNCKVEACGKHLDTLVARKPFDQDTHFIQTNGRLLSIAKDVETMKEEIPKLKTQIANFVYRFFKIC